MELHSQGILYIVFAPSLYLSGPIVGVYSTFGYLRSPARAASLRLRKTSVVSHLHHLCDTSETRVGPDSASGEYILFQSRRRQCQPERETPLTPAPSCEVKSAASVAFRREWKQSNTVKTVSLPWECPPPPHTHTRHQTHTHPAVAASVRTFNFSFPLGGADARHT